MSKSSIRKTRREAAKFREIRKWKPNHSLEYLQYVLREFNMTWGHFFELDRPTYILLRDVVYTARAGYYMEVPVAAVIASSKFVAIRRLNTFGSIRHFSYVLPTEPLQPNSASGIQFSSCGLFGLPLYREHTTPLYNEIIITGEPDDGSGDS